MPKGKGKGKKSASGSTSGSSASANVPAPTTQHAEYEEMILTFDDDQPAYEEYQAEATSSAGVHTSPATSVSKKKSIKSNSAINLQGPMEVAGSVKSMASVTFDGDFAVRK